ncbi:MAG: cupin domain-containing protein [Cyanobacteria bacterium P01_A01_bin.3]
MSSKPSVQQGHHFAVTNAGPFADLGQYAFEPEGMPALPGKLFLKSVLQLTGAEVSLNHLPAKTSMLFYHTHQRNEEIYIVVSGEGEYQVDDVVFPIREGSVVRVDCAGERCLRSTGDRGLSFITVQVVTGSHSGETIEDGVGCDRRVSWVGKTRLE